MDEPDLEYARGEELKAAEALLEELALGGLAGALGLNADFFLSRGDESTRVDAT